MDEGERGDVVVCMRLSRPKDERWHDAHSTSYVSPNIIILPAPPCPRRVTHLEAAALGLLVEGVARLLPVLVRLAVGLVEAPHAVTPRAVRGPVVLLLPLRTLGFGWVIAGGASVKWGRTNDEAIIDGIIPVGSTQTHAFLKT